MSRKLDAKRGRMASDIRDLEVLLRQGKSPAEALAELRRRLQAEDDALRQQQTIGKR